MASDKKNPFLGRIYSYFRPTGQLTKSQLFLIAITLTIVITVFFPPINFISKEVFDYSVYRDLPQRQQALSMITFNYVLPSVLIFWVLLRRRVHSWINLNEISIKLLRGACFFFFAYLAGRIFAGSIPGGGASYVFVLTFYPMMFIAGICAVLGLIAIAFMSIKGQFFTTPPVMNEVRPLNRLEGIFILVFVAVPCLFLVPAYFSPSSPIQRANKALPMFEKYCEEAGETIYSGPDGPGGILFLPSDQNKYGKFRGRVYSSYGSGQKGEFMGRSVLYEYDVPYIEAPPIFKSQKYGSLIRLEPFIKGLKKEKKYGISAPESKYLVSTEILTSEDAHELGVAGYKVSITNRLSNKLIAAAKAFSSKPQGKFCGNGKNGKFRVADFVGRVLNLSPRQKP